MYCVASLGENDSFWRYRVFPETNLDVMRDFICALEKQGCLVRVFKKIDSKEIL